MSDAIEITRILGEVPHSQYLRKRPPKYMLATRTLIQRPLDEVFEFFSDASNLAVITPPDMGFRVLTPLPIKMAEGTQIDYRVRALGLPLRWRTVIDVWEPGRRFVDSQVRGPYSCWWHEHRFVAAGDSCEMFDTVYYTPPFSVLGDIAQRVVIARELRRIFTFRAAVIRSRYPASR